MKNLVLGALLVAASSTGCIISSDSTEAVITANWSFTHFADLSARSCPTGFQTATIVAQPWDPISNELFGTPVLDKFNCSDATGTTDPLDGIYLVWVQIETDSGSTQYAKSKQYYVDTADGDAAFNFNILDDAGFFFLTWDLVDAVTQAPLTCKEAAGTGNSTVETHATIAGTSFLLSDAFPCDHGFGTTAPLLAGNYTVSVNAAISSGSIGTAPALANKVIKAQNGLTDLGHVLIPID
jgi:hypothetical protein